MSVEPGSPAEKLAALNERMKGAGVLALLNIKGRPPPDAFAQRVAELRDVVFGLCAHLPADDPTRAAALASLKRVEALLVDPLEWHILQRAQELRQDASDPKVRSLIENAFFEQQVPRAVWLSARADGADPELRKSMRLPVDFEADIELRTGKTRCRTHNISRDGVCLDVPADFSGKSVQLALTLPSGQVISVIGAVVWQRAGRAGVSFKLAVAEQNALDQALQRQFEGLQAIVERWVATSPKNPAAIACAALVGYSASPLPSMRKEHLDKLTAATQSDPNAPELQLALIFLRLREGDLDGAEQVMRKAAPAARNDARFDMLQATLLQRRGKGVHPLRLALMRASGGVRAAIAVVLVLCTAAAVVISLLATRGPFKAVDLAGSGGFACAKVEVFQRSVLCHMDGVAYRAIPEADRPKLAERTLQLLTARGVTDLTIVGSDGNALDNFHKDDFAPTTP